MMTTINANDPAPETVAFPDEAPRLFDGDVMRITVINEGIQKDYLVYKNALQAKSPYFAAAATNFKEGKENHATLSDIDHDGFYNIVHWLYTNKMYPAFETDRGVLIHTWAAADRLMMNECKNVAMDTLRRASRDDYVNPSLLALVEKLGHSKDSTLAQFLLEQMSSDCFHIDLTSKIEKEYTQALEFMPIESLAAAFIKFISRTRSHMPKAVLRNLRDPSAEEGCYHHEHAPGEKCHLKGDEEKAASGIGSK